MHTQPDRRLWATFLSVKIHMLTVEIFPQGSKSECTAKNEKFRQKIIITVHLTKFSSNSTCWLLNQRNYATMLPCHSKPKIKHDFITVPTSKHKQKEPISRLNTQKVSYAKGLDLLPTLTHPASHIWDACLQHHHLNTEHCIKNLRHTFLDDITR